MSLDFIVGEGSRQSEIQIVDVLTLQHQIGKVKQN